MKGSSTIYDPTCKDAEQEQMVYASGKAEDVGCQVVRYLEGTSSV